MERGGEKLGWTLGWAGSFSWVPILAIVLIAKGRWMEGLSGLACAAAAAAAVALTLPWRHPGTRYWRLMLAPYLLFVVSGAWAVWAFGGFGDDPSPPFVWLTPALLLLTAPASLARRTWAGS